MEISDLILVHREDPMIQIRFVHPQHIDVVILRNPRTVTVNDAEKGVNVLLVTIPLENDPHDDLLVHEVIQNHQCLAILLNVEMMMDISINLEVDGTRMIKRAIRRVLRQQTVNVGSIQLIKSIYSMSPVYTVLMDVFSLTFNYF